MQLVGIGSSLCVAPDEGLFLGQGLFETIRVEENQPLYAHLHWQRISQAAKVLNIPLTINEAIWHAKLHRCLREASFVVGGIKAILIAGRKERNKDSSLSSFLFQAFEFAPSKGPIGLVTSPWMRDPANPVYQLKTISYLENQLALTYAHNQDADDVLFFNTMHHATETSRANLFVVKKHKLITPRVVDGLLPGIIRQRLLALCVREGLHCFETSVDKLLLDEADALFTTNALHGIRIVDKLDGKPRSCKHSFIGALQEMLKMDLERSGT